MAKDILYPLRWLHGQAYEARKRYTIRKKYRKQFSEMRKKNPKSVFLVMTPEHGNLGDHAIAHAEVKLLEKYGVDYLEITGAQLDEWKYQGVLNLMDGYPILINGGGNLGTLWIGIEDTLRKIIASNPNSSVFVLPNTIFYEDSAWGQEEFAKSKKIYNQHKNLHLYAREGNSYQVMRDAYNDVKIIPDMVLSLEQQGVKRQRKGCLLCLRGDCEKTRTEEQERIVREQAVALFGMNVTETDMFEADFIAVEQREAKLLAKFNSFAGAELVITDRLHGMIFCAITGTPCIVIDSKSPKVRGCYEWIKHLDYIRFADDASHVAVEFQKIPQTEHTYDNSLYKHYYDQLAEDILSKL